MKYRVLEFPENCIGPYHFVIQSLKKRKWWKKAEWQTEHRFNCRNLAEAQKMVEDLKREFVVWESE